MGPSPPLTAHSLPSPLLRTSTSPRMLGLEDLRFHILDFWRVAEKMPFSSSCMTLFSSTHIDTPDPVTASLLLSYSTQAHWLISIRSFCSVSFLVALLLPWPLRPLRLAVSHRFQDSHSLLKQLYIENFYAYMLPWVRFMLFYVNHFLSVPLHFWIV